MSEISVITASLDAFLDRWRQAGASERGNYGLYLTELCDVLGVTRPDPARPDNSKNDYVIDRSVVRRFPDGSATTNYMDLYKKGCFVLEAKQGADPQAEAATFSLVAPSPTKKGIGVRGSIGWATEMLKARFQAEQYAKDVEHGWPPFLIVVDVGYCIELWSDFSRTGKNYSQFPDRHRFRIFHEDTKATGRPTLADPKMRALLAGVWTDPVALDPSLIAAKVTRKIAGKLAELAKAIEHRRTVDGKDVRDHDSEEVALFLMRCLFTMFAEDVGILPKDSFRKILQSLEDKPHLFAAKITALWQEMDSGKAFSAFIDGEMPYFNGKLFKNAHALAVSQEQLALLIDAAAADWSQVEPAIFGTLLERALDEKERHKLGAHYTPRAYVERLVLPTVIEPLRALWQQALAEATVFLVDRQRVKAIARVVEFHKHLCTVKVLDPACGTGNFLYVTLEHMKRLEGEVLQFIADLKKTDRAAVMKAHDTPATSVTPGQFKGIEVNPRAAILADVVLWIGYLQWHANVISRTEWPYRPIMGQFNVVERRDAVLDWQDAPMRRLLLGEDGKPVTRWDGVSTRKHPVTGLEVPDEAKVRTVEVLPGPKKAVWPEADYVVGNPPFIGNKRMRVALGDGYVEALRKAHGDVAETVDFVMYWWDHAAQLLRDGKIKRFGFITTNSITQTFNRQVIQAQMAQGVRLAFAVPDHPWVDTAEGAAVRVAMTVATTREEPGLLAFATDRGSNEDGEARVEVSLRPGIIHSDLAVGVDVTATLPLSASSGLSKRGVIVLGSGFLITQDVADALEIGAPGARERIRRYAGARELMQQSKGIRAIDVDNMELTELRQKYPSIYQWLFERVKPERDQNRNPERRENWWKYARRNTDLRSLLEGLPRYIVTPFVAKHRCFAFMDGAVLPDDGLISVGSADACTLGVLSSRIHATWAFRSGSTLEDRPRYNNTLCFEKFPFPAATEAQQATIRALAEDLDAHRKRQQAAHADLTLTGMYNVLAALREGRPLTDKERAIHDKGLCTLLRQLHDELDAAVFAAYGWPPDLDDEQILQRLCDLNAERVAEERQGLVRWLRPEFQNPSREVKPTNAALALVDGEGDEGEAAHPAQQPWPKKPADMLAAVRKALAEARGPLAVAGVVGQFDGAQTIHVEAMLAALAAAGGALELESGDWVAG